MFLVFFFFAAFFTDNTLQSMIFLSILSLIRIFFVDKEFPNIRFEIFFIWALIPICMYWLREDINAKDAIQFYIRLSIVALLMIHFIPRILKSKYIQSSSQLSILIPRQFDVMNSFMPDVKLLSDQRFRAIKIREAKRHSGLFNYLIFRVKEIKLWLTKVFHLGLDFLYQIVTVNTRLQMLIQARGGFPDNPKMFRSFENSENGTIIIIADLLLISIALSVALPESVQFLPTEIVGYITGFWQWATEIVGSVLQE